MISKAVGRYLRVSPRKAREVIALIKGRDVNEALEVLNNTNKGAVAFLIKLLNSAIANARRIPNMREEDLYISNLFADGGPSLKRYKAQALGRATMIRRRTSHITVELEMKEPQPLHAEAKRTARLKRGKSDTQKVTTAKASGKKLKTDKITKKKV